MRWVHFPKNSLTSCGKKIKVDVVFIIFREFNIMLEILDYSENIYVILIKICTFVENYDFIEKNCEKSPIIFCTYYNILHRK